MVLDYEVRQDWIKSRRKLRKQSKEASVRRKLLKLFLTLFLFCICIYGFSKEPWYINNFEKDIVISGNNVLDSNLVKQILCPYLEKPLYQVNPKLLEERLEHLSIVNRAFARRYVFPKPKVEIAIWEEFPWALVSKDSKTQPLQILSQTGRLITISDYPKIERPNLLLYTNNDLTLNSKQINKWQAIIAFIERETGDNIKILDLSNPFDIRVALSNFKIKLGAIDNTFEQRLKRLPSLIANLNEYKNQLEYIDLSLDSNIPVKLSQKIQNAKIEHD